MTQRKCEVNLTKKFHEENLNYCSVNPFTFFTFKELKNVKTLKSFFPEGYSIPTSKKEFFGEKKHV